MGCFFSFILFPLFFFIASRLWGHFLGFHLVVLYAGVFIMMMGEQHYYIRFRLFYLFETYQQYILYPLEFYEDFLFEILLYCAKGVTKAAERLNQMSRCPHSAGSYASAQQRGCRECGVKNMKDRVVRTEYEVRIGTSKVAQPSWSPIATAAKRRVSR